jgi:hypothetical protein
MHCLNLRRKRRVSYKEELINGLFYNSFGKVPYLCCIEAKGRPRSVGSIDHVGDLEELHERLHKTSATRLSILL